ncbi:type II secretion system F family protein [Geodermatophilus sabuli]|uniref:Type II secretion system F family protein n=1 Tax=Geodermatophilus sabuli TaxID=1564158 RepID=A0A7K3W6P4_9ACTN|nr:type II secretion system F family protein [Geodermatophilus sabuli]NEK60536.1 type II secretion system F family protein [Geodermatophilus sabuli]
MTWAVVPLLAAALALWPPRRAAVVARARSLAVRRPESSPDPPGAATGGARRRWPLAAAAGLAAGLLVGGPLGGVAAVLVAVGVERLLRSGADDRRRVHGALVADLPVACDLIAVCLAAGLPVGGALAAVSAVLPGPLGPELATVAGLYRLGAPLRQAWAEVPPELTGLGRVLVRAGESGSAVVPALQGLATDTRAEARSHADAGVRRAGVWVLAPLGVCFLPAFLCLGVVPLVLGIAADVF